MSRARVPAARSRLPVLAAMVVLLSCVLAVPVFADTFEFAGGTVTADYRISPRVKPGASITGTVDITVSGVQYSQMTLGELKTPRTPTVAAGLVYYDLETAAAEAGASNTKEFLQRLYYERSIAPLNHAGSRDYAIARDGTYRLVLERDLQVVAPQKEGSYVYFLIIGVNFLADRFAPQLLARVPVQVTAQAGASTPTGPEKRIELSGTPSLSPTEVKLGEEFIIEVPYRVKGLPMTGGQTVAITEQTQIVGASSQSYSRTRDLTSSTGETDVPSKFKATVRRAGKYNFQYTVSGPGYAPLTGSIPFEVKEKSTGQKQLVIDSVQVTPQTGSFRVDLAYHATDLPQGGLTVDETLQVSGPASKSTRASRAVASDGRGQATYEGHNFKGGRYTCRVTLSASGYQQVSKDASFTISDQGSSTDWADSWRQKQQQGQQPQRWTRQQRTPSSDRTFTLSGNSITANVVIDGNPVINSCTFSEPPAQLTEGQSITMTLQIQQTPKVGMECWWQSIPAAYDAQLQDKTRVCSEGTRSGSPCSSNSTVTSTVARTGGEPSALVVCVARGARGGVTYKYKLDKGAPPTPGKTTPAGTPELVDITGTAQASIPADMSGAWYGSDGSAANVSQNRQSVAANTRGMMNHASASGSFQGTHDGQAFRGTYSYTDGNARGSGTMTCSGSGPVMNCQASGTRTGAGPQQQESWSWRFQRKQ